MVTMQNKKGEKNMVKYVLYEDFGWTKGNEDILEMFSDVICQDGAAPLLVEEYESREAALKELGRRLNQIHHEYDGRFAIYVWYVQEEHFNDGGKFLWSGDIDVLTDADHIFGFSEWAVEYGSKS